MPDERLDSMRQGIGAPPESAEARRADEERREAIARDPVEMEGAMGGSSDSDSPGDEAAVDAAMRRGIDDERSASGGGDADAAGLDPRTARETREAGLRAQGGGSPDEGDIRRSAGGGAEG